MVRITIEYSEDFRENKKVSDVFGILRDSGFDPTSLFLSYNVDRGTGSCVYIFRKKTELPTQERLEEMLEKVGLAKIVIEDNS